MTLSIITVAFNSAETLRDTMRSVLAQSYPDWEHIIVDGGSTDGTLQLIERLEPEYGGRLRWVSETDGGLYDAMNKGLAMATGDAVGFLNSDDFFSSDAVLTRVARTLVADRDTDAVYGDVHFVAPDDLSRPVRHYSSRFFRRWLMPLGFQPAHPSLYCRRDVYRRFGGFDTSLTVAADFEQMLRSIYVGRIKARYLAMDFVTMRTGGASTAGLRSHRRIVHDHFAAYRKNRVWRGYILDFLRYPLKIAEVVWFRLTSARKHP